MTTRALLLIDIQNDYFDGGRMPLVGSLEAAARAAELLAAFRQRAEPVFHVQHISTRAGASFFLPDTDGVRIHASVAPQDGEPVVVKHFPNAFRATPLAEQLRAAGVARLTVAGMMTHMCIDTSVRAAADLGFECVLAADACATRDLVWQGATVPAAQVQAAFLAALNGSFARVASVAELFA
ncbi:MAG: cysteine hydrolase [Burkholderiales bacterium]|jgi:nicotinamidase-related amidase|nr:cysteine hydrolase [Burkholderiales bacterium]